ncbi:MAG: Tat pathway signal protein [Verrucomicrobia bacterium]|nr:Tat pathway signal protein [Verrucomicrobiota bacterium]
MRSAIGWMLALLLLAGRDPARCQESDDAFLERVQEAAFRYFWKESNPANGLIRDRSRPDSKCSIAAVGFGLSAIAIGVDHGWISRAEGRDRAMRTLETLSEGVQGAEASGVNGYRGWYYHFLEMDTGHRAWKCELSSVDTALLLAGALDAAAFFSGEEAAERRLRDLADRMVARVDWEWMANGGSTLTMGWHPESGFLKSRWVGYNEAMILVLLALGARETPPAALSWEAWTRDYRWETHHGHSYVVFAPLFGHQYSHCWVDFRGTADAFMRSRGISYFENSRRAALAQRAYCVDRAARYPNYGPWEWGITACDGPDGYAARGAPPAENDDGTLAPTAVGGSVPFAPEVCIPTLRELERRHGVRLWGPYGFRDAFNRDRDWWATDTLGIDQGPILLMIENHRTGAVWRRMSGNAVLRRGLERAGFRTFPDRHTP